MRFLAAGILSALNLFAQQTAWAPYDGAFNHFYNLEYDQAIAELERGLAAHPDSANLHNYMAQCIQFREMFKVGALESELVTGNNSFLRRPKIDTTPEVEKRFFEEVRQALSLSEARLKTNPNDTKALYALGVTYGLRGNWNFLVRKAWRDALSDATLARKMHSRVTEIDPSDYDARLVQGAHDYIIGSLPTFYKMLGFLVGYRGDRERGIRTLQEVAQKGKANSVDAEVFLCAIYRREEKWKAAAPLLQDLIQRFPRNYLLRFEQAQMFSSTGEKDKAIATIQKLAALKKSGAPGFANLAEERIWYQIGNIQFWYRDYDQAVANLKKAVAGSAALDLNTGTLAWMRLGQVYDMTNRRNLAVEAYRNAINFAPQAEAAKESRRYLSTPYRREG
ncbi:MAG TPA: tetratricopeptide repeat protein [Bryobacteraceae bacterium]|jgi:tetratricopeptide (TPR) repeat protein|nr:tetratricopeptide repeat protein [Bryobacteraceae bacterium]